MVILVTGASGQVGQALRSIESQYADFDFHFMDSSACDITDKQQITNVFSRIGPDFCINAAAYTAVDKAESEPEKARELNVNAARNLARVCEQTGCTLVHLSTDFVFDGQKSSAYVETDATNPQSVYGLTKRDGEIEVAKHCRAHYIIRTSWVYSQFGNNFMKTMLRLARERDSLSVVDDQIGSPTHAVDLAHAIMGIITSNLKAFGTYHFSNEGQTSWYGFAIEIFAQNQIAVKVNPVPSQNYPTPARRPAFSLLDKTKFKRTFNLVIRDWKEALAAND